MFWSLGSFGDLSKEAGEAWRMQSGSIARSGKLVDSENSVSSRNLEGSST